MKILFLAVLLFSPPAAMAGTPCPEKVEERTAPCTASEEEQRTIMRHVQAGVAAHDAYEKAVRKEKALRKELLAMEREGREPSLEQRQKWEVENNNRKSYGVTMQTNLDKALELTRQYYGLGQESRAIVDGPLKGYAPGRSQFVYAPKDEQGRYKEQYMEVRFPKEQQRRPHFLGVNFNNPKGTVMATTLENGSTVVSIEAFRQTLKSNSDPEKMSPRLLAKTVYHEGVHVRQLVTVGWASREADEAEAYTSAFEAAEIFELTPAETALAETQAVNAAVDLSEVKQGRQNASPAFPSGLQRLKYENAVEIIDSESEKEVAEIGGLEAGLRAAREALERSRKEREAREEEERRKQYQDIKDEATKKVRWYGFTTWTLFACMHMRGVHPNDPEWGDRRRIEAQEQAYREYLQTHLVVLEDQEIEDGLNRRGGLANGGDLGYCQKRLIKTIRGLPGPADADWLLAKIEYEKRGGKTGEVINRVLNAVGRAVADGAGALVDSVSGPFSAQRERGAGPGPEHGGDRGDPNHGGGVPGQPQGPAYRRLQGISAHGW